MPQTGFKVYGHGHKLEALRIRLLIKSRGKMYSLYYRLTEYKNALHSFIHFFHATNSVTAIRPNLLNAVAMRKKKNTINRELGSGSVHHAWTF